MKEVKRYTGNKSDRIRLKQGEYMRKNGTFEYRWREDGKRHYIYAKTLAELREKEKEIEHRQRKGLRVDAKSVTLNNLFEMWKETKADELKENTFTNYQYMYNTYVSSGLGKKKVVEITRQKIKDYYKNLKTKKEPKVCLSVATIDSIHTVVHQLFNIAVEKNYIEKNPADNIMGEIKRTNRVYERKVRALTIDEQNALIQFLENDKTSNHWLPLVTVMLEAGLRACELTGLRWKDINLKTGVIDVNHSLVYFQKDDGTCGFSVNTPKTAAGERKIPMTDNVRKAFLKQKKYLIESDKMCTDEIDGYTDFIFVNRYGRAQSRHNINRALNRIVKVYNEEVLRNYQEVDDMEELVLLPKFSCHDLRHTCATRLCEAGVNMKFAQEFLGHADITTTMNIYTEATNDLKKSEIRKFDEFLDSRK